MRVLYINDYPETPDLLAAFRDSGIEPDVTVARTISAAREHLPEAKNIDVVFMDYSMEWEKSNTVDSGLVKAFVDAGFKMLVANSSNYYSNLSLQNAGCTHVCHPAHFEKFVRETFGTPS